MNRRTFGTVLVILVLMVGFVALKHRHSTQRAMASVPPTGQEPMAAVVAPAPVTSMTPAQPAQPAVAQIAPPAMPATPPPAATPAPESSPVAPETSAPVKPTKRFWGNRGYIIKDRKSTYSRASMQPSGENPNWGTK